MNARFQSSTRAARTLAAMAALATVVALFEFVAGLGESNPGAAAEAGASSVARHDAMEAPSPSS